MEVNQSWTTCSGSPDQTGISRRQLAGLGALALLGWASPALAQTTFAPEGEPRDVLVVVFLRGGMDGLNLLIPTGEDNYYRQRPSVGVPAREAHKLTDMFALHPAMRPLFETFDRGEMSLVHACGSGDQTRSHFEAMNLMETGRFENRQNFSGGWIARTLESSPRANAPLRAISFSDTMPDSLQGATGALALNSIQDFKLEASDQRFLLGLEKMYGQGTNPVQESGRETLRVLKMLEKLNPKAYKPSNGAVFPNSGLAQGLQQVAMLIRARVGLEIACLDLGGWDTHVAQGAGTGWFARQVEELSTALAAFLKDLGPETRKVTVLVQTEFGRRLQENTGLGTDHGRGSVAMVLGGGASGGIHGKWPGLRPTDLDEVGDLRVANDYRNVIAEILAKRMKMTNPEKVFANHTYSELGVCRA
ncbi:MAG: DUF1501 domain-containing protein [Armatimonadetes bacterium]|nr:DUF1501 domain-containing protein [Armatimonadota bacterium]